MAVLRTNAALNPMPTGAAGAASVPLFAAYAPGTGATGAASIVGPDQDGPTVGGRTLGYARYTMTTPKTGGSTGWQATSGLYRVPLAGDVGGEVPVSVWVRLTAPDVAQRTIRLRGNGYLAGVSVNTTDTTYYQPESGEWIRLGVTYAPTGPFDTFGWWVYQISSAILPAGATFDIAGLMIDAEGEYFDGSTPNTPQRAYEWTGAENASASVEIDTAVSISATLLSSGQPRPVQVLAWNIAEGSAYTVVGVTADGRTWAVPGGVGVSDGEQLRLIDNRAPVNVPISYRLTVGPQTVTSEVIPAVPWSPPSAESRYLIQSLSGSIVIPIRAWQDNDLPREIPVRSTEFAIHARRRPVVVLQPAAYGTTVVQLVLDREPSERLDEILGLGGAICVRTQGRERDLPPTDLAVITEASSALWGDVDPMSGEMSSRRLWDLTLTWIDDPEPSTIPTVYTVDDVDALLAGMTVDEVDAMFSDLTVDQVDAFDWAGLQATAGDPIEQVAEVADDA